MVSDGATGCIQAVFFNTAALRVTPSGGKKISSLKYESALYCV